MKQKKKKAITFDDLALMMGRGFQDVDKRFVEVHKKMDKGFQEVYEKMGEGFQDVHEEIGELRGEFSELKGDFNNLQIAIDGYTKKADTYFRKCLCWRIKLTGWSGGYYNLRNMPVFN